MTLAEAAKSIAEPVLAELALAENELANMFADESEAVKDMAGQANQYGGKRLRPILVLLCGGMVGTRTDEHPKLAAIVEILHMASLMHDDVLDEADTRRQVTTLNALYGNQLPILMGDLVYTRAFSLSISLSTLHAAHVLARASEAICLGEIEQSFLRYSRDYDESRYYRVIELKTGELFGASCELGARYAGGTDEQTEALREFGESLGMGFQIIDDCLDIVGDEGVVGKSLGTDLETGKVTLPIIRLAQTLDDAGKERLRHVLYGDIEGRRRDLLAETFDLDPIVARCQEEATDWVRKSLAKLDMFDEGPEKSSLRDICTFIINRTY